MSSAITKRDAILGNDNVVQDVVVESKHQRKLSRSTSLSSNFRITEYSNMYKIALEKIIALAPQHSLCSKLEKIIATQRIAECLEDEEIAAMVEIAKVLEEFESRIEKFGKAICTCSSNSKVPDAECYAWFVKALIHIDIGIPLVNSICRQRFAKEMDQQISRIYCWAFRISYRLTNIRNRDFSCKANSELLEKIESFFKEKSAFFGKSKKPSNSYFPDAFEALKNLSPFSKALSLELVDCLFEFALGVVKSFNEEYQSMFILNNAIVDVEAFKFLMFALIDRIEEKSRVKLFGHITSLLMVDSNMKALMQDNDWSGFLISLLRTENLNVNSSLDERKDQADFQKRLNIVRMEMNLIGMMISGAVCFEKDYKVFMNGLKSVLEKLSLDTGLISSDIIRIGLFSSLKRIAVVIKNNYIDELIDWKIMLHNLTGFGEVLVGFIFFKNDSSVNVELQIDQNNDLPDILIAIEADQILMKLIEMNEAFQKRSNLNHFQASKSFVKQFSKLKEDLLCIWSVFESSAKYLQMLRDKVPSSNEELMTLSKILSDKLCTYKKKSSKNTNNNGKILNESSSDGYYQSLLLLSKEMALKERSDPGMPIIDDFQNHIVSENAIAKQIIAKNIQRIDEELDQASNFGNNRLFRVRSRTISEDNSSSVDRIDRGRSKTITDNSFESANNFERTRSKTISDKSPISKSDDEFSRTHVKIQRPASNPMK